MKTHLRILVAVDSSHFSSEVLKAVSARGWESGTHIRILSVVQPAVESDVTQQCMRECQVILDDRVRLLAEALPNCEVIGECAEGGSASTIIETAQQWSADLIIIGSHGGTGPRPTHLGSVAAAVVEQAPCSVAVVKLKSHLKHSVDKVEESAMAR